MANQTVAPFSHCDRVLELKVGVLAVQGAFFEHEASLLAAASSLDEFYNISKSGGTIAVDVIEVRDGHNFRSDFDGLIIPGGESTVMSRFLTMNNLGDRIQDWMTQTTKAPIVWGTCAGMILLANSIEGQKQGGQSKLGGMDVTVSRNYFGRQINSFESDVTIVDKSLKSFLNKPQFPGVFIRAPAVVSCTSDKVTILGTVKEPDSKKDVIVAVQQDNLIATAFHPELTDDLSWHKFFIKRMLSNIYGIAL